MEVWSPRNCIETPFKEKPWKRIIIMTTNFNMFESFWGFLFTGIFSFNIVFLRTIFWCYVCERFSGAPQRRFPPNTLKQFLGYPEYCCRSLRMYSKRDYKVWTCSRPNFLDELAQKRLLRRLGPVRSSLGYPEK